MRSYRRVALVFGVVVLLGMAGVLLVPMALAPQIEAAMGRATGCPVRIGGVSLLPRLAARDIELPLGHADRISAQLVPAALLHGRIEIATLAIDHPVLRADAHCPPPPPPSGAPAVAAHGPRIPVTVDRLLVRDGVIGAVTVGELSATFHPPAAGAAPVPPPPASPATPPGLALVIPDTPLPFGRIGEADADVSAADVAYRGYALGHVAGHLAVGNGRIAVKARASGPGNALLAVDLTAAGATAHALAADLNGSAGIAMENGQIDGRALTELGDLLLRGAMLPGSGGTTQVRCLAVGLTLTNGVGVLAPVVLDSTRLRLVGDGTVNFADESLALHATPVVQAEGTGIPLPLRIGGSFARPKIGIDALAAFGPAPRGDACPAALARVGELMR